MHYAISTPPRSDGHAQVAQAGRFGVEVATLIERRDDVEDILTELSITDAQASIVSARGGAPEGMSHAAESDVFLFGLAGLCEVRVGAATHLLNPGRLLHVPFGETFSLRCGYDARAVRIRYHARIFESLKLSELLEFPTSFETAPSSLVRSYFSAVEQIEAAAPFGKSQCLKSLVTLILIALVKDCVPDMRALLSRKKIIQMRRLLPAVRALRQNLADVTSVHGFARRCGLSAAQFRRLFHTVFERSPAQYIQHARVREACRLLHHTDHTVNEISLQIGYEQPSHFHKTFKKLTGMTPRSYREEILPERCAV